MSGSTLQPLGGLAAAAPGVRGVFTDVDDTLTHDGALVAAAYDAIVRARAAGLRVVPVTGRPAGWGAVLAATWPVDAVVAENGAVVFEREETTTGRARVVATYWDPPEARAEASALLGAIRDDVLGHVPRARVADDQWLRQCDLAFDVGETQTLAPDEIAAIVARIGAAGARSTVSSVHAHAFFGGWDKARMLARFAARRWGEDLADEAARRAYVFVGDSENDQAGFAAFPLSVGVANVARVADRLRPPPAFVTPSPGGHGFAELMALLLAARDRAGDRLP